MKSFEFARLSALLGIFLCGCAEPPPVRAPAIADAPPKQEKVDRGPLSYETEIGGLNEEAMDSAMSSLARPIQRCFEEGASRLDPLGGHVKLSIRVDRDGSTKWAYLSESTIGDRETEKCMLDAVRTRTWPRPVGGEGMAEKSFDIDARTPTTELDHKKINKALAQARSDTAKCRRGISGSFLATAYVRRDGHVVSAGVAPPSARGEDAADCIVEALLKVRFKTHNGGYAKVSFAL